MTIEEASACACVRTSFVSSNDIEYAVVPGLLSSYLCKPLNAWYSCILFFSRRRKATYLSSKCPELWDPRQSRAVCVFVVARRRRNIRGGPRGLWRRWWCKSVSDQTNLNELCIPTRAFSGVFRMYTYLFFHPWENKDEDYDSRNHEVEAYQTFLHLQKHQSFQLSFSRDLTVKEEPTFRWMDFSQTLPNFVHPPVCHSYQHFCGRFVNADYIPPNLLKLWQSITAKLFFSRGQAT